MNEKHCYDMDFEEYKRWAREHVIEKFLESGLKGLSVAVHNVVDMTRGNKVFGGNKHEKWG